jgi:hypothetical protein
MKFEPNTLSLPSRMPLMGLPLKGVELRVELVETLSGKVSKDS